MPFDAPSARALSFDIAAFCGKTASPPGGITVLYFQHKTVINLVLFQYQLRH